MFLEAPLSIYDRRFASAPVVVSLLPRVDPPSSRPEPSALPVRPCRYDFEQLGCRRCHFPIRLREEEIEGGATGEDSSSLHSERKKRTEGKGSGEDRVYQGRFEGKSLRCPRVQTAVAAMQGF